MGYQNVIETLRDRDVRNYFLGILQSQLPAENKLEKFVAFFDLQGRLEEKIAEIGLAGKLEDPEKSAEVVSAAAQQIGVWRPQRIREKTEHSLRRGVTRILNCQHRDGGWGHEPHLSNLWGTAYAVMALKAAKELKLTDGDLDRPAELGLTWIERWLSDRMPASTYDAALAVRCLYRNGRSQFAPVGRCFERFLASQNTDGGWYWLFPEKTLAERPVSEVGATSFILQAFSVVGAERFRESVSRGINWLVDIQDEDGSWSELDARTLRPELRKSVNKTCDALNGINAGTQFGLKSDFRAPIEKGVNWIFDQEKLVRHTTGWGYIDEEGGGLFKPDLVSTCLVLETLMQIEGVSLPLISANALWLISAQHGEPYSVEDGKWIGGDTFRITLALIEYFNKIKDSPLFRISPAP